MPHLVIKGVPEERVLKISSSLISGLSEVIGCPEDWLIIEAAHSTFFGKGESIEQFPIVEVLWYRREREVQDRTAAFIGEQLKTLGYGTVQVIFTELDRELFYEFEY